VVGEVLHVRSLLAPPALEVRLLDVCELASWDAIESEHHASQDVLHVVVVVLVDLCGQGSNKTTGRRSAAVREGSVSVSAAGAERQVELLFG